MEPREMRLLRRLVTERTLVLYGPTDFKVLGGTMSFTMTPTSQGYAWLAVDENRVIAQADDFPKLWELVEARAEKQAHPEGRDLPKRIA